MLANNPNVTFEETEEGITLYKDNKECIISD